MRAIVETLAQGVGRQAACAALGIPRSSFYRRRQMPRCAETVPPPRPTPPRALALLEKERVRARLDSPRFQDEAPREVYATLLDEGEYLCSWRTMYRILAEHREVRERRNQLQHPAYVKPVQVTTGPNQLWSWDITQLLGPSPWTYYYLYVILDVFSRYVPGWLLADVESAKLAHELIATSCARQGIVPGQLTLHADHGAPMTSKTMAQLLTDLHVTESHSRPHVSNDNPYSEAQFKTMKYRPTFPERFGSLPDARVWAKEFFTWYNQAHHHSSVALLTPAVVHTGRASACLAERQRVLDEAYAVHPERFVRGRPVVSPVPPQVWINRPQPIIELAFDHVP